MTYSMTLFIADKTLNNCMEDFDLKHKNKVYVSNKLNLNFKTTNKISEDYFINIINKSEKNEKFWITAIKFCNKLFVHKDIKEISDGEKIIFIKN